MDTGNRIRLTQSKRPEFLQGEEHTKNTHTHKHTHTHTHTHNTQQEEEEREVGYVMMKTSRKDEWNESHRHSIGWHGMA